MLLVSAALIRDPRTGRVLIARRSSRGSGAGKWEFPGGKAEPGEGLSECLVREIDEELGVEIEVVDLLGAVEYTYPGSKALRLHLFEAGIVRGEPEALEHDELRWVDVAELPRYDLSAADRRMVESCSI